MDESLGEKKEEQINQIGNFETKNNNLNEIYVTNSQSGNNDSFKFYTCPDDYSHYRSSFIFNNYSFTPFSRPSIGENYSINYFAPAGYQHVFPTIKENFDVNESKDLEKSTEKEE